MSNEEIIRKIKKIEEELNDIKDLIIPPKSVRTWGDPKVIIE